MDRVRFVAFSLAVFIAFVAGLLPCAAAPATAAELMRSIRESGLDPAECYRVRDLNFNTDEIKLYFNDGYLTFSKPVMGQRLAAIFSTDVEGGDGEMILIPPSRTERESLASFTGAPNLDEHLSAGLLILTDGSMERLLQQVRGSSSVSKAPDMGPVIAGKWDTVLANVVSPMQMRLLSDLLAPAGAQQGMAFFALSGKRLAAFDVIADVRAGRRIEIRQAGSRDGKDVVNIWTSFAPRGVRNAKPANANLNPVPTPTHKLSRFRIETEIANDMAVRAVTHIQVTVGPQAVRAFPFELAQAMQVDAVMVDGAPAELIRDSSTRARSAFSGFDDQILVVTPEGLSGGSEHEFVFNHHGNVIATRGEGVYFVNARGSWYPHLGTQFSLYDLTFRYPKRLTLVAAGEQVDDHIDGDARITRRRTTVPIGSAGFNLGSYEKVTGTAAGIAYEVYGNRNLDESLRPRPVELPVIEPPSRPGGGRGGFPRAQQPAISIPPPPDPLGRLRIVADDLSSSLEFFNGLFGPPVLKTLTVAPIPGTFGQGFPGLVYLSTFAYLNPTERPMALRNAREQVFFSDLLVPHEAAHQWWGSVVSTQHPEDRWMTEALANYSALLWLEKKKGFKEVEHVLSGYREELLAKPLGTSRESAGPIVWGERLETSAIPEAWRVVTYDKGTWILHMLRRRLGDPAFLAMLKELRRRYEFRSLTTAELVALVRELRPKNVSAEAVDTFFDTWVYGTGIPALKIRSTNMGVAPAITVTGTLTQREVADDFSADIPVEIQFAKGPPQIIWVRTGADEKTFTAHVSHPPVRVVIANDLLARH